MSFCLIQFLIFSVPIVSGDMQSFSMIHNPVDSYYYAHHHHNHNGRVAASFSHRQTSG